MKKAIVLLCSCLFCAASQAATAENMVLPPCKSSPNCVSSQAEVLDKTHYIAPFKIAGDPKRAWELFREALVRQSRININHETKNTLHAEATTLVLRFVDDITAILDEKAGVIHVRSASRLGHTDFGVNRKRIELLRTELRKLHVSWLNETDVKPVASAYSYLK